jgi:hypothetical protein
MLKLYRVRWRDDVRRHHTWLNLDSFHLVTVLPVMSHTAFGEARSGTTRPGVPVAIGERHAVRSALFSSHRRRQKNPERPPRHSCAFECSRSREHHDEVGPPGVFGFPDKDRLKDPG